jgi:hypothetical protein
VPSGVWVEEEYAKLIDYDAETHSQPLGLFQCHQTGPEDRPDRLCAGWVACHGSELLALRIAVSVGSLDPSVMGYTTDVPLFGSGTEAAEHGMAEIDDPSVEAQALMAKITGARDG